MTDVRAVALSPDDLPSVFGSAHYGACNYWTKPIGYPGCICKVVHKADAERDARDAARYRWLRDVAWNNGQLMYFETRYGGDEWDERIDAALASEAGHGTPASATAQTASEDQSNV